MAAARPCPSFSSPLHGVFSMSSPSKDLKETESYLRSVIQTLIDGQEGFKKIGEEIKDEALKEYFLGRITHPCAVSWSA